MKVTTTIPEVLIIKPKVFGDDRDFFFESFNARAFEQPTGLKRNFIKDNHSRSATYILYGLHYQIKQPQGKLACVVLGEVFDVAGDTRKCSRNFSKWVGIHPSSTNKKQLWIPKGLAHGSVVLNDTAEFLHKTPDYYAQEHERGIRWDSPDKAIQCPVGPRPLLSAKDQADPSLQRAEAFA